MSTRFSSLFSGIALGLVVATPVFAQATPEEQQVEREIVMSCQESQLPDYRNSLETALKTMRASIVDQWKTQVDFRVRAASPSRRAAVQRVLTQNGRQLDLALDQFAKTQLNGVDADMHVALDAYVRFEDTAEDQNLERWSNRTISFQTLDSVLARLERTLRTYAATRDRSIITRVWNETRKQAENTFTQSRNAARDAFIEEMDACVYATPEDDVIMDEKMDQKNDEPSSPPVSEPKKTEDTSSADTSFRVTSINTDTVSDYAGICSQRVMARAHIYTRGVGRTSGYFLYHDGQRSPEIIADTDAMGHTYAQHQREYASTMGSIRNGWVKFITTMPNAFESNRADFKIQCFGEQPPAPTQTTNTETKADARLMVEGKTEVNTCGMHRFTFTGTISYGAPGMVKYYWLRSDGSRSPEQYVNFEGAGTKTVTDTWDLGLTYRGWVRLIIIAPNQTQAQADINLIQNCMSTDASSNSSSAQSGVTAEAMVSSKAEVAACGGYLFQFKGVISGQPGTKVVYRWERNDGVVSPETSLLLENGSQSVAESWNLGGNYTGWVRLQVTHPAMVTSNQASFKLIEACK